MERSTSDSRRGSRFALAALGLILLSALGSGILAYWLKVRKGPPNNPPRDGQDVVGYLFRDWSKPDLVVVLSAQQHGYLLPCGCSSPQLGGLERRYNFIQMLKARGWPVVAVDLGDIPQKEGPAKLPNVQGLLKYRYSMMALEQMSYLAVGVGEYEGALSLKRIEEEWAARSSQPAVLAANLKDRDKPFPHFKAVRTQTVPGSDSRSGEPNRTASAARFAAPTSIKVGVTSVIGPRVTDRIQDPAVRFVPSADSLREQWEKLRAEKVDLPILLYQGTLGHSSAADFPEFPIILALSDAEDPPDSYQEVRHPHSNARTRIVRIGHKGKHVGVLGVYRSEAAFSFKYRVVAMGEEFATPPERRDEQPIVKLMEQYTRELKAEHYLRRYDDSKKHPLQELPPVKPGDDVPRYIGSEACGRCHEHERAYKIWKASKHSHAYQTLVDAKHPSLRQYDGECVVCHTVGFGQPSGFKKEADALKLGNVGCESCHGPGSLHKSNPNDKEWQRRMHLPWAEPRAKGDVKAKNVAIEKFCVTCHDTDNDVTWKHGENGSFLEKWVNRKIVHNEDTPEE
jgi:hypothetical protein